MRIKRIVYSSHFVRALKKLWRLQDVMDKHLFLFRKNCFDPRLRAHKLKGKLNGYWSFSITQTHRVLFEFLDDESVVFVDIGDHSIYQ